MEDVLFVQRWIWMKTRRPRVRDNDDASVSILHQGRANPPDHRSQRRKHSEGDCSVQVLGQLRFFLCQDLVKTVMLLTAEGAHT